ncbi:MFS transporter [Arthrobacter sp. MYb227]|uniref:MFS transporter n=1 Tax=Arthrobacter sp. MYb227 TaxID=1848601 RepID=UPI000CFB0B84|nr:MFS transporter [Arthrobacter sp. MYb227]PQZ93057.1 MFS transporter [Arthrobacter sp. MYb227]
MNRQQRVVLQIAILASFVAFLDGSIVNVALPAISKELGGGISTQQWVLDGYLLSLGALILVAGSLSDIFGRVKILRTGLLLFGIASLLCVVAPNAGILIAARLLQGAAAALLVPSSLAMITSEFPEEPRAKAIGTWTAWTGTAFVAGPLLGGLLVDLVSWRLIFAINIIPIAVTLALLVRLHDPARSSAHGAIDLPGAFFTALGLAGTVYSLIVQGSSNWSNPVVYLPFCIGLLSFALFFWRQSKAVRPMMPLSLFRERNFSVGNVATAAFYAGISLGTFIIPVFLQEAAGFSAFAAGLATIPVTVLSLALSTVFGILSGKYGPRLFMCIGPLIAGSGFLLMVTVANPLNYWQQLLPGILVFGLGMSITVAPLTATILGALDASQSGIGSAINNAVARVAGLIAIAAIRLVTGPVLDTTAFHRVALLTALLLGSAGIISGLGISNSGAASDQTIPPESIAACHDKNAPNISAS